MSERPKALLQTPDRLAERRAAWHCTDQQLMERKMAEPVTLELFSDYV